MLKTFLEQAIADCHFPGAAVAVLRGGEVEFTLVGQHTYDPHSPVVTRDSLYDVASVTKSIPTACLVMTFLEAGKLRFDDKLITYVPEFRGSHREDITIEHLLRQSLNYRLRLSHLKGTSAAEVLEAIYTSELTHKPGEVVFQSNATSILLTMVLERVAGKGLDDLASELFFEPLGMSATTFHPDKQAVPTEHDTWRGRLMQGEVHDESAFTLRDMFVAGSAGLFSTVSDLSTFMQMLLSGGEYQGKRYFSAAMLESMGTGLGWEVNRPYMGEGASAHTFAKRGFTGCFVLADLEKQLGVVMLANTTYPKRKPEARHQDDQETMRTNLMNIIWKSL